MICDIMLNFPKPVPLKKYIHTYKHSQNKLIYILDGICGSKFSALFYFGWIIPLNDLKCKMIILLILLYSSNLCYTCFPVGLTWGQMPCAKAQWWSAVQYLPETEPTTNGFPVQVLNHSFTTNHTTSSCIFSFLLFSLNLSLHWTFKLVKLISQFTCNKILFFCS